MTVGMPDRACAVAIPAPICPAPRTPTRLTSRGLTDGSDTPGSRASRWPMKKTPIRFAEIGEPTTSSAASCSAFRPSSSVRLHPSRIAFRAASGAGYCPLVFPLTNPSAAANRKFAWSSVRPDRLLAALAARQPLARLDEVIDEPLALFDEPLGRDGVEREPEGDGLRGVDRVARADHLDGRVARRSAAGSRCVPPQAGRRPTLTSGSAIFVCGLFETIRSSIARISSVPPAHAVAVDQGDRRERQPADLVEQRVAEADPLEHLLLRGERQGPQLVQVGPGDEVAGLAAPEQEARAGRSAFRAGRPARPAPSAPPGRAC